MTAIKVAIINSSTLLTDAQIEAAVPALQEQVHRDFAPVWGVDADITFVGADGKPPAGSWWLSVLDNSDQASALGYHDATSEGLPLGKVFAKTDADFHANWTVTASHELIEMLADPEINLSVFVQDSASRGKLFAYELCDACEDDQFGYKINGTMVSNFVYPSWFESFRANTNTQFDHCRKIGGPFELLPGGYIGFYDVMSGSGWQQQTAEKGPFSRRIRPSVGSRRERRRTPRDQWKKSDLRR
jgi:hypothetical protein